MTLQKLCKTALPPQVSKFIRDCTATYGKAKLVLKNGMYLVQTVDQNVQIFANDPVIKNTCTRDILDDGVVEEVRGDEDMVFSAVEEAVNDSVTFRALREVHGNNEDDDQDVRGRKEAESF